MAKKVYAPFPEDDVAPLLALMRTESSDRGAILIGAALLDERVADLLAKSFVSPEAAQEIVGGFDAVAGHFRNRIDLAHAMGLLTDKERRVLHAIRDIRNAAAHFDRKRKPTEFGFGMASLRDSLAHACKELRIPAPDKDDLTDAMIARSRFSLLVVEMSLRLGLRCLRIKPRRVVEVDDVSLLSHALGGRSQVLLKRREQGLPEDGEEVQAEVDRVVTQAWVKAIRAKRTPPPT